MDYPGTFTREYNECALDYFNFRPFFASFIGKSDLVGVEVGTFEGYNSLGICRFIPIKRLYCIDPYKKYHCVVGDYMEQFSQAQWERFYREAQERLRDFPVEFIHESSVEGAEKVPNELDFVYLDGDHSVGGVFNDLKTWYPKVKSGGKIGGHDFLSPSVKQGLSIWMYEDKRLGGEIINGWNDWWIIKQ